MSMPEQEMAETTDSPTVEGDLGAANTCPDCGLVGQGYYCTQCGEELQVAIPTVGQYLKELINEFIAFDSKLLRTIPLLLFKPGYLTQEYVAGRRRRYLLPSRVYLLFAFLTFFLLSFVVNSQLTGWLTGSTLKFSVGNLDPSVSRPMIVNFMKDIEGAFPYVILLECLPVFALLLKLIFRKQKKRYVEHLVFSFHFFAVSLVVIIPAMLIPLRFTTLVGMLIIMTYLFFAIRRVYSDKGAKLWLKFLATTWLYFSIILEAIIAAALVGAAVGYLHGDFDPVKSDKFNAQTPAETRELDSLSKELDSTSLPYGAKEAIRKAIQTNTKPK